MTLRLELKSQYIIYTIDDYKQFFNTNFTRGKTPGNSSAEWIKKLL
ncbi:hypothetical protein LX77_00801 [Gelidibacter algens]|uniref:Uncharacterized protein n=1 Tax=Gelidibacter algens TaxID=49280 RepID=A0A327SC86_9FLAO|nr:hypothetical protein LX77_00801 [Gelidibacter algens]